MAFDVATQGDPPRPVVACLLPRLRTQPPRLLLSFADDWLKLESHFCRWLN